MPDQITTFPLRKTTWNGEANGWRNSVFKFRSVRLCSVRIEGKQVDLKQFNLDSEAGVLTWSGGREYPGVATVVLEMKIKKHRKPKHRSRPLLAVGLIVTLSAGSLGGEIYRDLVSSKPVTDTTAKTYTVAPLQPRGKLILASKSFLESHILMASMALVLDEETDFDIRREYNLDHNELWEKVNYGFVHAYPDYSGTLLAAMLGKDPSTIRSRTAHKVGALNAEIRERAPESLVELVADFGFSNSYKFAMMRTRAKELGLPGGEGLRNFTDLAEASKRHSIRFRSHPDVWYRPDGLPGLRSEYKLSFGSLDTVASDQKYRALRQGEADVVDGYETDPEIAPDNPDFIGLNDNRQFFPRYRAVIVARRDIVVAFPEIRKSLGLLESAFTAPEMSELIQKLRTMESFDEAGLRHTPSSRKTLENEVLLVLQEKGVL